MADWELADRVRRDRAAMTRSVSPEQAEQQGALDRPTTHEMATTLVDRRR